MAEVSFTSPSVPVTHKMSVASRVAFQGNGPEERIYGLGEHRTGSVNMMPFFKDFAGSTVYSESKGADSMIPWYMSSRGYGFLWNLPSYGNLSITPTSITWCSAASRNVDFWVTTTPANVHSTSYASLLQQFVEVVGRAPVMPFYASGFIQSKNRYRSQEQLLKVAKGYKDRKLPISVIVIDFYHWVHWGDWSFDPACWPDPSAMVGQLEDMGVQLMVTFWPFQTKASKHWHQFSSNNLLATLTNGTLEPFDGSQFVYDPFNQAARNATFQAYQDGYGKFGIKTVWLDAAEPERPNKDTVGDFLFAAGTDSEVGSAWVQQHVRTFSEGLQSSGLRPEEFLLLPRHAWTGTWRHSAALWSGDIPSTFPELATQVRLHLAILHIFPLLLVRQVKVLQGVMMSGVALWTTDIGGYSGGDPADPEFQELIVRWFQFGAFCPLFRLHGARGGGPPADR